MNRDSVIDLDDLPHFINAQLAAGFTGCDVNRADINQDGLIDGRATEPFLALLLAP